MSDSYKKVQSVAKKVISDKTKLNQLVLKTMKEISDVVGSTLGPGGQVVLIEQQQWGAGPMVTKDGVTVFRHLGFDDPAQQAIMEAARDAATKTATEAGDGTSASTILAEAIVAGVIDYCTHSPKVSPQQIVRSLQKAFNEVIEPTIKSAALPASLGYKEGRQRLHAVAKISGNGDEALADAVLECFDLTGDEGNVSILDVSGPGGYEVEHIDGYPISMGFEDSAKGFSSKFINDAHNQRVFLEKPAIIVYHGQLTDIQPILPILDMLWQSWSTTPDKATPNVVVVACGYGERVLANFAYNAANAQGLKVFPLLAPMFPVPGGQLGFLEDLVAVTGQKFLFDPINNPLTKVVPQELGRAEWFEATRFRSNIVGSFEENEDGIFDRVEIVKHQLEKESSRLEKTYLQERLAMLTGGIARLKVSAPSAGEMRERKDRADDAVCAVRGAIKHGALPGGGWMLLKLSKKLVDKFLYGSPEVEVLAKALQRPFYRLLSNAGISDDEIDAQAVKIIEGTYEIYNPLTESNVNALEAGILDSVPAVLEAIKNSLSIASLLGILGGVVVFKRDEEFERREAGANNNWIRGTQEE